MAPVANLLPRLGTVASAFLAQFERLTDLRHPAIPVMPDHFPVDRRQIVLHGWAHLDFGVVLGVVDEDALRHVRVIMEISVATVVRMVAVNQRIRNCLKPSWWKRVVERRTVAAILLRH